MKTAKELQKRLQEIDEEYNKASTETKKLRLREEHDTLMWVLKDKEY